MVWEDHDGGALRSAAPMRRGPIAPIVVAMLVMLAVGGLSFVLLFHDHALASGAVLIGDWGLLQLFDRWYRRRWPPR